MVESEVSIGTLNALGSRIKELRDLKDSKKKELEQINCSLRTLESEFMEHLENSGMRKYSHPDAGTIYTIERLSYKSPKEPGEREAFFNYLKERGLFNEMISVHSATLNAWAKEEIAQAEKCGVAAHEFEIPGLGEPTYSKTLGMRKS